MRRLKPLALACLSASVTVSSFAELEEIIVTATKREANVQEIPIAVTALSGDAIARAGINDIRDLSTLSPSFNANSSSSETGGTTFRIRGIGTTGNNIGLESAVGVFIDGIYYSRPGIALGDLVDVERIEILRGPQGTLFGRNTSAGALSIVTKKASLNETNFFANATFGNYDSQNYQVGGTFPLIEDQLGFRFSASKRDQDGFIDSSTGAQSVTRDRYSGRAELLWAPNDDMEVRFIADMGDTDESCCDAVVISESALATPNPAFGGPSIFGLNGLGNNGGVTESGSDAVSSRNSNGSAGTSETEQHGFSAQLDWDLGWADLTAIGSYRQYTTKGNSDVDYTNADVLQVTTPFSDKAKSEIDTWTAELRLQGSTERLDWMVGAYYADEDIDTVTPLALGEDFDNLIAAATLTPTLLELTASGFVAANPNIVLAAGMPGTTTTTLGQAATLLATGQGAILGETIAGTSSANQGVINNNNQESKSWSIFTHNTFAITQNLDFVFGLRWSNEEKTGGFHQSLNQNNFTPSVNARVGTAIAGLDPSTFAGGLNANNIAAATSLGNALGGFFGAANFFPAAPIGGSPLVSEFDQDFDDEELTYTAKLVYQITDKSSAYISYSHGFKAGGLNLDPTAAVGSDPAFDSETNDTIEIGYKADLFDNRLRANLAIFHSELEDFQVLQFDGTKFTTFNVPKAFTSGVETEFLLSALDNFDVNLALTYQDARYPSNCDEGKGPEVVSRLCGNDLTNAPEFVGVLGGTFFGRVPGTELVFFANGNIRYEAKRRTTTQAFQADGTPSVNAIQSGNSKTNLRIGIGSQDGKWSLEAFGNNITDKQTYNVAFGIPLRGATGVFLDAPRTYGLTLRTEF